MSTEKSTPKPKGPLVYLDYDQAALDDAYTQLKYAPNMQQMFKRFETNSEVARSRLGPPVRLAYGAGEHEKLDLYKTKQPKASVNVFLHGGGWHLRHAKDYGFAAELFVNADAHYIALDFMGVESTGGTLPPIVEQLRNAIAWIHKNAASFGGDPDRIYLSGHSSGGHLGAVLLTTDWEKRGVPRAVFKGGLLSGGMYDLEPVSLSLRSAKVKFDKDSIAALSPIRHVGHIACPITLAYGSLETPEFQRHGTSFHAAIKAAGKPVKLVVGEGYNHFEMTETLSNPYGFLGRAALEQMGLVEA